MKKTTQTMRAADPAEQLLEQMIEAHTKKTGESYAVAMRAVAKQHPELYQRASMTPAQRKKEARVVAMSSTSPGSFDHDTREDGPFEAPQLPKNDDLAMLLVDRIRKNDPRFKVDSALSAVAKCRWGLMGYRRPTWPAPTPYEEAVRAAEKDLFDLGLYPRPTWM